MLHALLHLYNQAPPKAKSAARAGAAFLAGAAIAVVTTACSPAYAQPADRGKAVQLLKALQAIDKQNSLKPTPSKRKQLLKK